MGLLIVVIQFRRGELKDKLFPGIYLGICRYKMKPQNKTEKTNPSPLSAGLEATALLKSFFLPMHLLLEIYLISVM
jgi:hypothetical protein